MRRYVRRTALRVMGLLFLCIGLGAVGCSMQAVPPAPTLRPVTVTLTPSPTPTRTPTPTPTATPTPTPTPLPADALAAADRAAFIGDWDAATLAYQRLLTRPEASETHTAAAGIGLAKVHIAQGAYADAIAVLRDLPSATDAAGTTGTAGPEAQILLGDALRASGDTLTATLHYSAALAMEPALALYVHEWMGDAYGDAGAYISATTSYSAALAVAETAPEQVWLLEKMALAALADGDPARAVTYYDAILDVARIADYRARILYQAAETLLAAGEMDAAYDQMLTLVETYPTTDPAYQALVILVEAEQPVDEMLRGLVDYHAAAYGPAVQAFARVVADPDHDGEPHYYAGLSYLAAGSPQLALQEFDLLIETHPDDPLVADARLGKADALAALGRTSEAVEAYRAIVEAFADSTQAPAALWDAASLLSDSDDLAGAAELLVELADAYPNDQRAPEARFWAGIHRYRAGTIDAAQEAWRDLARWYPYAERTQGAWLWLGKTYLDAGNPLSATEALSASIALGPWDFYGLQAASLLAGEDPLDQSVDLVAPCDTIDARSEAEAWLAEWLELAPESEPGALPVALRNDVRFRRGELLLRVGHFEEGRIELEKLRESMSDDALAQYRLALAYRDLGLYRSSIIAATTLWRLSPAEDLDTLPRFIGCLVYPTYYSDLVEPAAAEANLSSLFVYALLRQESLFEGYATSFAAARGLMQVIPSTGEAIARALAWPPDYTTADLYRPMVSVRFGVWYLAEQRDAIDGDLFAAMAGYNGGPGNSRRWWQMAEQDPDLFVELIGFSETRRYVRLIREHFAAYRWLYGGK